MATVILERPRNIAPVKLPALTLTRIDQTRTRDAGFYVISPATAKAILADRNAINRQLAPAKLQQIIADVEAGNFTLNGESVIFSDEGQLLDGQHRLVASVETARAIESVVVFGIQPKAQDSVDQGKPRGTGDVLSLHGYKNGNSVAAVARSYIGYLRTGGNSVGNKGTISRAEIQATVEARPDIAPAVEWAAHMRASLNGICSASIMAFCRVILEQAYGEEAVYYLARVALGDNISLHDPAHSVRKRLMESGVKSGFFKIEAILRGAVAHIEGRKLTRVQIEGRLPPLPGFKEAA